VTADELLELARDPATAPEIREQALRKFLFLTREREGFEAERAWAAIELDRAKMTPDELQRDDARWARLAAALAQAEARDRIPVAPPVAIHTGGPINAHATRQLERSPFWGKL